MMIGRRMEATTTCRPEGAATEIARTGNIANQLACSAQYIHLRLGQVALAQADRGPTQGPNQMSAHLVQRIVMDAQDTTRTQGKRVSGFSEPLDGIHRGVVHVSEDSYHI